MGTRYWMARSKADLFNTAGTTANIDLLANTITDLPHVEYIGPTPEPGQTLQGTVQASSNLVGRWEHDITVWVHAEHEED